MGICLFATKSKQRLFEIKATIALPFQSFGAMTAMISAKKCVTDTFRVFALLINRLLFNFIVSVVYVVVLRSLVAPRGRGGVTSANFG